MSENKLFQNISFEEALRVTTEYEVKCKELKNQGAKLNGEELIDKEYTELLKEGAEYHLQFSEDELLTILGHQLSEIENQKVDNRELASPVRDQGTEQTSVGFATASTVEVVAKKIELEGNSESRMAYERATQV